MNSDSNSTRSTSDRNAQPQVRTYKRKDSAVFSKTKEEFGGLSNMAAGFPVSVNGVRILTSEALYQACRFPHLPQVQRIILQQSSPMTAKMKSKPYRKDSRPDWERVRVKIMRWCLRVKLAQNWNEFSRLLLKTGDRAIVEESRKDDFWGAKVVDADTLSGMNVLGRLLMELREEIKHGGSGHLRRVEPPPLCDFLLFGKPIEAVEARPLNGDAATHPLASRKHEARRNWPQPEISLVTPRAERPLLFERTASRDARKEGGEALVDALKPYPEYKDTGLSWLGKIPAHWGMGPGFAAFREKQVRNTGTLVKQVLSLSYGKIVIKPPEKLHGLVPDSFESYQIVDPGDIIIRSTDLQNDWTSLRVGLVRDRGIITSAYLCFETTATLLPEYGYQLLHAFDLMKVFYGMGSGLRQNLNFLDFKRMSIITPPLHEQTALVQFLNHANRRIDRFVRAKKKVIALLNEQKQAIIHRAVTRGIDAGVTLTPSNAPWLPEAPAHWTWIPIKRLLSRMDYGTSEAGKGKGKIRLLTMGNVQKGEIILPQTGDLDSVPEALLLGHNDLLFTRTNGNPDLVGKVGIFRGQIDDNVSFASYLVRLRVKKEHSPEWLHMVLNSVSFWPFARSHALVNLQTNLNSTRYGQLAVPVPPKEEQIRIVDWVTKESEPVATAIHRTEREIELIREYRTRLIADVVTGKLDVREAASALPATEETESPAVAADLEKEEFEEILQMEKADE